MALLRSRSVDRLVDGHLEVPGAPKRPVLSDPGSPRGVVEALEGKDLGTTISLQHKETGITAFAFKDRFATLLLLSNGVRSWG